MRKLWVLTFCLTPLLLNSANADKYLVHAVSAEHPITVDGRLDEDDWGRRLFYLGFKPDYIPTDNSFSVTAWEYTSPEWVPDANSSNNDGYTDTSLALVTFLHYGTDLYIGISSDDQSVCKRFPGWEGDGIHMRIKKKGSAIVKEYNLAYVKDTVGSSAEFWTNAPEGSGEGASYELPGTITNSNAETDAGYTMELVIHLDSLDPTFTSRDTLQVSMMIFDMDYYIPEHAASPDSDLCDYFKVWWGSEWGTELRYLVLSDPPSMDALKIPQGEWIALDGQLNESAWAGANSLIMDIGSPDITNTFYMQYADTLNYYDDPSTATVKFLHDGTDLYIGVVSNDSSVCEWAVGWEADGLHLWIRDPWTIPTPGQRMEIKCCYFGYQVGSSAEFQVSTTVPTGAAEGVSYEFPGTVTHTDTGGPDHGYSLEVLIHTDMWGYVDGDSVWISFVIWDMDHSSEDCYDPIISDYTKVWWGSEWCDTGFDKYYMYRAVYLSPQEVVGVAEETVETGSKAYTLHQNHPNPFNAVTTIRYQLPADDFVSLKIYNLLGQEVRTLINKNIKKGNHVTYWDGKSEDGRDAANGVYFYRIKAGDYENTQRMVLLR